MRQLPPQRLITLPLAALLLAIAFAPSLLLVHEAGEHAEHHGCALSELALDVNTSGSLEHGAKTDLPSPCHCRPAIASRQRFPQRSAPAFSARAPPRVTGQIASVHPT